MPINHSIEPRVARLEGELEQLVAAVNSLAKSTSTWQSEFAHTTEEWRREVSTKIDGLNRETRPNVGLMAQWAGVVLSIIALVSTPIAFHFNDKISTLDAKLQKEYGLVNDSMKEKVDSLRIQFDEVQKNGSPITRERLAKSEVLDEITKHQLLADLEELHQRRLKDKP